MRIIIHEFFLCEKYSMLQKNELLELLFVKKSIFTYITKVTRNKTIWHVKRTTPHPPAQFGSKNYFSFKILQTLSPSRANTRALPKISN